ncbi:MAG: response regulator, partial [Candidatus Marinimicrobia bacterium]|nr:response regulator [Candidatus Neomarinimicrobiota bacterium]
MIRSIDLFRSSSRPPVTQADNEKSAAGKSCILVVAASSQIHSTLEQALESLGMELVILGSGEAADEFLLKNSVSVVISEINLPMMNGLTLARKIKENRSLQNTPILLVSDSAEGPDKVLGMETGADDYITLPINPAELRSRVMSLLSRTPNEPADDSSASDRIGTEVDSGAGAVAIPVDEIGLETVDEPEPQPVEGLSVSDETAVPESEPDPTHEPVGAAGTLTGVVDIPESGMGGDVVNPLEIPAENVATPESDVVQEEVEQPPAETSGEPGVSDQVEETDQETDRLDAGSMLDDIFGGSEEATQPAPASIPADVAAAVGSAPADTPPEVTRQEPPPAETPPSNAVEAVPPPATEEPISIPAPEATAPQSQPAQVPAVPVQPLQPPLPVDQNIEKSTIIPADEQAAPPPVPPQSALPPVETGEVSQPQEEVLPEYDFN